MHLQSTFHEEYLPHQCQVIHKSKLLDALHEDLWGKFLCAFYLIRQAVGDEPFNRSKWLCLCLWYMAHASFWSNQCKRSFKRLVAVHRVSVTVLKFLLVEAENFCERIKSLIIDDLAYLVSLCLNGAIKLAQCLLVFHFDVCLETRHVLRLYCLFCWHLIHHWHSKQALEHGVWHCWVFWVKTWGVPVERRGWDITLKLVLFQHVLHLVFGGPTGVQVRVRNRGQVLQKRTA